MAACFGLRLSNFQATVCNAEISYTIQYTCVYLRSFFIYEYCCGLKLDQGQDETCSNFCYKNQLIKICCVCGSSQFLINNMFFTSDESLQTEGKDFQNFI